MGAHEICKLDEYYQIQLSPKLQKKLGWEQGIRATARINKPKHTIEIRAKEDGELLIDDLSKITLNEKICDELGWIPGKFALFVAIKRSLIRRPAIKLTSLCYEMVKYGIFM